MKELNLHPIVREETTKERVYREIKEAILTGKIPTDITFTEGQLGELLNTSRTPVREAVQDLLKDGLVVTVPRKGLQVKTITPIEKEQIQMLRTTIETTVVKKVAEVITEADIQQMKIIYNKQLEARDNNNTLRFLELDHTFHAVPFKVLQYELGQQLLGNLKDMTHLIGLKALKKYGRMDEVLTEHEAIIERLEAKDGEGAAEQMRKHIARTGDILDSIQEIKEGDGR